MAAVIDTSIWVDLFHPKTPRSVREAARLAVEREDAAICEPVRLELMRGVPDVQYAAMQEFLRNVPMLSDPPSLWEDALNLARDCFRCGYPVSSMDTLIAAICKYHEAELVTLDQGFEPLSQVGAFQLTILVRGASG